MIYLTKPQSIEEIIELAENKELGDIEVDFASVINISEKIVKKYTRYDKVDWKTEINESAVGVQDAQRRLIEKIGDQKLEKEQLDEMDEQYDLWMAQEDLRSVMVLRDYCFRFNGFPLENPSLKWLWEQCSS